MARLGECVSKRLCRVMIFSPSQTRKLSYFKTEPYQSSWRSWENVLRQGSAESQFLQAKIENFHISRKCPISHMARLGECVTIRLCQVMIFSPSQTRKLSYFKTEPYQSSWRSWENVLRQGSAESQFLQAKIENFHISRKCPISHMARFGECVTIRLCQVMIFSPSQTRKLSYFKTEPYQSSWRGWENVLRQGSAESQFLQAKIENFHISRKCPISHMAMLGECVMTRLCRVMIFSPSQARKLSYFKTVPYQAYGKVGKMCYEKTLPSHDIFSRPSEKTFIFQDSTISVIWRGW